MPREFDELYPWEQYERMKGQGEVTPESNAEAGERLLTFWHQLMMGTFTGHSFEASPTTVARVLKVLSDADLLLTRLLGCGAIRTGIWFDPKYALERADELEEGMGGSNTVIETLRQVAQAWLDTSELRHVPPVTPHFIMAAMLYWAQGNEFSWPLYEKMMPRIFNVKFTELVQRLHLAGDPNRQAEVKATIDRVADLPVKIAAPVFVRFEHREWGFKTKDFGPYVWVEIIRDELKVAPTGRHLATLYRTEEGDAWVVADASVPARQAFTNIIIGPAEVPDGWVQPEDEPADAPTNALDKPADEPAEGSAG
jgi:hypothetical protein